MSPIEPQNAVDLQKIPGNETCADCGSTPTTWASVKLGVLVCIDCSGIHRSFGTHISNVKSITLDNWRQEWVQTVASIGNLRSNAFFERRIPPKYQSLYAQRKKSSRARERFLQLKYVRRRFAPASSSPSDLLEEGKEVPSEFPEELVPVCESDNDSEDEEAIRAAVTRFQYNKDEFSDSNTCCAFGKAMSNQSGTPGSSSSVATSVYSRYSSPKAKEKLGVALLLEALQQPAVTMEMRSADHWCLRKMTVNSLLKGFGEDSGWRVERWAKSGYELSYVLPYGAKEVEVKFRTVGGRSIKAVDRKQPDKPWVKGSSGYEREIFIFRKPSPGFKAVFTLKGTVQHCYVADVSIEGTEEEKDKEQPPFLANGRRVTQVIA